MNSFADRIIPFFASLYLDVRLPEGISILNPYQDPLIMTLVETYFRKYYDDLSPRMPVMGINPGRFGGGLTGISFTDPVNLETACGIVNTIEKRPELSSTFIFSVIDRFGGVDPFFHRFFLTAICPLGFTKKGKNYNYYDDKALKRAVTPFITHTLERQHAICGYPEDCICIGEGENLRFLTELNQELGLFKRIHPLPHPRFILQYKRKHMKEYIRFYLDTLKRSIDLRTEEQSNFNF
ncbi:MAG: DUF4918 family protein [Bacteroidales bacterium]|nr:DUF4918 family protein [Lentimicrobiaceae bacterium]MDD5694297.1 DUF4918 family protein [Bacteroidales bacterium]